MGAANGVDTKGILIGTREQADAIPDYSRGLWPNDPNQWFVTPPAPSGYIATNSYMLTHVATSVEQAAADRAEALADAEALRGVLRLLTPSHQHIVGGAADRMDARARRTLPDELADAYQAQQAPQTVTVELPRDVAEKAAHWATPYDGAERAVVDAIRDALDAIADRLLAPELVRAWHDQHPKNAERGQE